jgi:serine/threonine protein kinase
MPKLENNVLAFVKPGELMDVFGINDKKIANKVKQKLHGMERRRGEYGKTRIDEWLKSWNFETLTDVTLGYRRACGSYGCVFVDAKRKDGTEVAVKISKQGLNRKTIKDMFFETITQMVLSTFENRYLRVPKVYSFGLIKDASEKRQVAIVMEKLEGKQLNKATDSELTTMLPNIFKGLNVIQKKINFVHRDLHGGNIMFSDNTAYMVDFGNACISAKTTRGSILYDGSVVESYNQDKEGCTNRSHDVCTLLLALYYNRQTTLLYTVCKEICSEFKARRRFVYLQGIDTNWNYRQTIFHWHYMLVLYDIQLKFTPEYMIQSPTRFELIRAGLKF